jgi:hypothetical protein
MAWLLPRTLIVAGLVAGLAMLAAVPAGGAPAPPGPTVQLAPGTSVPPGRYEVVLRGGGREITTTATVVAATPLPPATPEPPSNRVTTLVTVALALLLLGIAGYLLNVNVRVPGLRSRRYEDLVRSLADGSYPDAVAGLTRLEAGLPRRIQARARFYICFGLYQMGEFDEAEFRLTTLHREEPSDTEVAYLLAYLRVKRRDHDGAAPVLAAMEDAGRLDVAHARRLYGVVLFQQATQAVTDGRIEAAAELFDHVERLGDFRDRVPVDLRSRHVVIGARALLDRDLPAARDQFTELERSTSDPDLRASAKIGQALTAWLENRPGAGKETVQLLTECLRLLNPDEPLRRVWPGPPDGDPATQLEALAGESARPEAERDLRQTMRDLHLLRSLALMRLWAERDVDASTDAGHFVAACAKRFACAVGSFADPYLVVGLLRYHLAGGSPEGRRQAHAELHAAHTLGVRIPEVSYILREDDAQRRRLDDYTTFLHQLATGAPGTRRPGRPPSPGRFGRVPDQDSAADVEAGTRPPPTVAELRERAELLAARVRTLGNDLGPEFAAAAEAAEQLVRANALLARQAKAVADGETALLVLIGGQLLPDGKEPGE